MKLLVNLLFILPIFSFAQHDFGNTYFYNDTLYTRSGFKIFQNQKIKIGNGTMPNGEFKFIRVSTYSLFRQSNNKGYKASVNQANSFSRQNAGLEFNIVRIDRRGNKKQSFDYFPIISGGVVRYEIDIDNAIASGEIIVPVEYKLTPADLNVPAIIKQKMNLADELIKLQKQYDDGLITKEKFEAQKKKLLENN